jgi:hypothetical protein
MIELRTNRLGLKIRPTLWSSCASSASTNLIQFRVPLGHGVRFVGISTPNGRNERQRGQIGSHSDGDSEGVWLHGGGGFADAVCPPAFPGRISGWGTGFVSRATSPFWARAAAARTGNEDPQKQSGAGCQCRAAAGASGNVTVTVPVAGGALSGPGRGGRGGPLLQGPASWLQARAEAARNWPPSGPPEPEHHDAHAASGTIETDVGQIPGTLLH